MAWSTIHVVYIYVAASCLDGDTIVTASHVRMMNADIFGVLQVYSVSVETVLRGGYSHIVDHHSLTVVKLKMAL